MSGRSALPSLRLTLGAALILAPASVLALTGAPERTQPRPDRPAAVARSAQPPLAFEQADGRFGRDVRFVNRGDGYALGLMRDGSTVLTSGRARVRTRLVGARVPDRIRPESLLPGKVNSFVGPDRTQWRRGLPTYGAVRYDEVYPGVDLLYHGRNGRLEYDYIVQPGIDPSDIQMAITGATPKLTPAGDLLIRTESGPLRQRRPVAFQSIGGRRVAVPASFDVDGRRVGFRLGEYDQRRPLVIDPQLVFTSYFGGPQSDNARAVAVLQSGGTFVLMGGRTRSLQFHGSNPNASSNTVVDDAWISKLSADGSTVIWTTFIGGTGDDSLTGISPGTGGVMVTGGTASSDFPVNVSLGTPLDTTLGGSTDAWIGRMDPSSGSLDVATYFGGPGTDGPVDVAYRYPRVYIGGTTSSASGIATTGAFDETFDGTYSDAYVAAFSANLAVQHWGTYIGGSGIENAGGFTMDQDNPPSLYITGTTQTPPNTPHDFPVTAGTQTVTNIDSFLVKLPRIDGATSNDPDFPADGTELGYSRLVAGLPGPNPTATSEVAEDIWANSTTAVLVGYTDSPTLAGSSFSDPSPGFDGFVLSLSTNSPTGLNVNGGALLGGSGNNDSLNAVTAPPFGGNLTVAGVTDSPNLATVNPVQSQLAGATDALVAKFSGLGNPPVYVSYLGGTGSDQAFDVAVDQSTKSAFVAGDTGSTNLGATATYSGTPSPVQPDAAGSGDAFLARIEPLSAVITGGPGEGSTIQSSAANFTLGPTSEPSSLLQCKLDNGPFATCTSTPSFSGLADGPHTLSVRYFDRGSDTNGSVAVRNWTVDTTAPPTLVAPSDGADLATTQPELSWDQPSAVVAGYDVELDGKELGLNLGPSARSYAPGALSEGVHDWRVIAVDQFGTKTASALRSFRVDLTPPNALLSASPNPSLAGRIVTLDASSSTDPAGGHIVRYEWDLDGDGTYEVDGGSTPTFAKQFNAPGSYLLAVRVTDGVGQMRAVATTLIVTTPPVPPGQLGVTVNNGAQYTRSPDVKLNLKYPINTTQLLISNDGGFLNPTTFVPNQEIAWKLDSSGPERLPKTVYGRFLLAGLVSETYTDDIILDETPPVVQQATVVAAPAAASIAALKTFTLKLKATDSNSGVNGVQISGNKKKPGKFLKYKTRIKVKAATRKLYVRARDRAGNLSAWRKAR